jgi:hypothetical protein
MRNYRRLLAAVMALAAAALALTASAQAQTLELTNEANGTHCPAVTLTGTDVNGGCMVHATGEGSGIFLRKHVFGVETTVGMCNMEFHGRANEDGGGYLFEQVMTTPPSGSCNRQPCKDGTEAIPWAVSASEGAAVEGTEYVSVNFCIEPLGGGADELCEIDLPFNETSAGSHSYEIGHNVELASHGVSGFRCEAVAPHWSIEAGGMHDGENEQDIEMIHLS